jgi:hypothetical protein
VFAAAVLTILLLVLVWVVPTPAAPATFTAPFTITGPGNSKMVVDVNSKGTGLMTTYYNRGGGAVLIEGVSADPGAGLLTVQDPDVTTAAILGITTDGQPDLKFVSGTKTRADIGWGKTSGGMGISIWNDKGLIVDMGERTGNGYLMLADAQLVSRVEAGTEKSGDGAVRVYGPTGKCGVALAGISCMIVAR